MDNTTPQDPPVDPDDVLTGQPDGEAFVDRSEVNPQRRIIRARRPPPNPATAGSASNTAGGGAPGGNGASGASTDLSGAIGFLQQLNGPRSPTNRTVGANNTNNEGEHLYVIS